TLKEVEWFDSHSISSNKQSLLAAIPDCKGEHATKVIYARISVLFISMNDRFGVRLRLELVPKLHEFRRQGGIVVNLAVEDDQDRLVFVEDRLPASPDINDAEPPVPEAGVPLNEVAGVVR